MVSCECREAVWRVSGGCLESVSMVSSVCLVSDWRVFGVCMNRVFGKIYLSKHSLVYKYLIHMIRTGWVKTGWVNSCLHTSWRTFFNPKFLDLKCFWIQYILGEQKCLWPKILWIYKYFGIKIFLDPIILSYIFLTSKSSSSLISSVALSAQLVLF